MARKKIIVQEDLRNIRNGHIIPCENYCDQPYVVITDQGHWLCVLTTGVGVEGKPGQHVVSTISRDQGKTWSELQDIEPADGPEASWVMPLKVPGGRIYVFYTYNSENRREAIQEKGAPTKRVDTLGSLMFKYSDDHGMSWSQNRYRIPIREMEIDRLNPYQGKVQYFWGVGKPIIHQGSAFIGLAKVGQFGEGFMACSESILLKSSNILSETDPLKLEWVTLPEGDHGLRAPLGRVADELNPAGMNDGSLYCTYRTVDGHNCHAYSRDGGLTWTPSAYASYSPGGKLVKHPRAANFVRKFSNGHYILWYHNHGKDMTATPSEAYNDRNPAWISGGVERDGYIYWSQPEIVLYDDDPVTRMSYPDFIEEDGNYFVTETQKTVAKVHEIDAELLEGIWTQANNRSVSATGLLLDWQDSGLGGKGREIRMPELPDLREGKGFSLDIWINFLDIGANQTILDTRTNGMHGIAVVTTDHETLKLIMNDGRSESAWESDIGLLAAGKWHHVVVIVDGGPKLILFVVDGVLCDGGDQRQFGWGRFIPSLGDVNGLQEIALAPGLKGTIGSFRIYGRYLRTSEAVSHYFAGSESFK
jgi:hypothetical protein